MSRERRSDDENLERGFGGSSFHPNFRLPIFIQGWPERTFFSDSFLGQSFRQNITSFWHDCLQYISRKTDDRMDEIAKFFSKRN